MLSVCVFVRGWVSERERKRGKERSLLTVKKEPKDRLGFACVLVRVE